MLKLPAFNAKVPAYSVRILGNLVVYKNDKHLLIHTVAAKLSPKDAAFLINLVVMVREPGKRISLRDLFSNFWPRSKNPATNLSHMLVRIKKVLRIPPHLLAISHRGGEAVLINRGIHFVSDYTEFEQILATAHAFERVDKWAFARREYLHAFRLFRGEPFKKMYDPWSEQMRRVILNKLETEAIHFAKNCLKHENNKDAKRILQKVSGILPKSEEIRSLSDGLMVG